MLAPNARFRCTSVPVRSQLPRDCIHPQRFFWTSIPSLVFANVVNYRLPFLYSFTFPFIESSNRTFARTQINDDSRDASDFHFRWFRSTLRMYVPSMRVWICTYVCSLRCGQRNSVDFLRKKREKKEVDLLEDMQTFGVSKSSWRRLFKRGKEKDREREGGGRGKEREKEREKKSIFSRLLSSLIIGRSAVRTLT